MAFVGLSTEPAVEVDRINVGLALVNWCVLLLLLCGLLLAKTLPAAQLTSGLGEDCTTTTAACAKAHGK